MSLDISEAQQIKNKKRLIQQNKMLHQEVLTFQKQLNQFLTSVNESMNPQTPKQTSQKQKELEAQIQLQKKQINKFRSQLAFLKSKNIKQNIQYILKEQDDLNILKKQLYKYRKEKQIIIGFKLDKLKKLQINNPLNQHQNHLKNQLKQTIKFNRQTYAKIVQIERDIRKYHEIADIIRRIGKDKINILSTNSNQQDNLKLVQIQHQVFDLKSQIKTIQQKWKTQLNALDDEYFQLNQLIQLKKKNLKQTVLNDNYFKSRMSVVRSQSVIESDRKRKQKIVTSPKLKKQLQEYIKKQQEKLKRKNNAFLENLQSTEQPKVENIQDDKNLKPIKNYKNNRPKLDKNISVYEIQQNRSERTWNNGGNSTIQQSIKSIDKSSSPQKIKVEKQSSKQKNKKVMPILLLKNIGLGTSFHQN